MCLARQDYVHEDPRGERTGDFYDMTRGEWRAHDDERLVVWYGFDTVLMLAKSFSSNAIPAYLR